MATIPLPFLFFFLFTLLLTHLSIAQQETTSPLQTNTELTALLSLKNSITDDPLHQLKNWVNLNTTTTPSPPPHCNWTGIACNSNGLISKLDLSNMNLTGTIPDNSIQSLTSLTSLNLSSNTFASSLPKALFSNLTSLVTIDLSQNEFIGPFPHGLGKSSTKLISINASSNNFEGPIPDELGYIPTLQTLDFRGSFFQGTIPKSLTNLQNLKYLGLSGNNLTGSLPEELGQLSSLETMILGYNQFKGPIPATFGNLTNLQYLDLAVGSLTGQIPPELGKLQNLTTVYLYMNSFTGNIPPEIGNSSALVYLDLSDNTISGEIPAELGRLNNLQLLNLMCNNLTGKIPNEIGTLPNLRVLALWQNSLIGHLPQNLGNFSQLQWLDVSSNNLSGEIPPELCNSGNLTKLILFNNSLSGPIPSSLSRCDSLIRVRIHNNLLQGSIPSGVGNLPKLQRLELENNNLTGDIPDDFSLSTSLSFVDVSGNKLQSSIPSGIFSIPTLITFMASNNDLIGHIPNQFQDCPSLSVIDLSSNHLTGQIPESIASCQKMVKLLMSNNQLKGEIPRSIATMPTLAILDLSNNSLTGQIPENFGNSPALETMNVSYNKLQGPMPTNGMFTTINPSELAGNPALCGGILLPCDGAAGDSRPSSRQHRIRHISRVLIGLLVGISTILGLALAVLAGRIIYRRWYLYSSSVEEWFKKNNKEWPWTMVAFQRLNFTSPEILACIKESNIVGMGATGIVYRAETHRPFSVVAVKKLWRAHSDEETGEESMLAEVNLLGKLRHRNIVRMLGYLHNESDMMMIYEYMPNGNLWTALHGDHQQQQQSSGKILVDWVSRYNIAVGVAQGLAYLHHDCHPCIIHRDVKSNNILLDANFEARIADFGLARTMLQKNETVSMVAGSYGYIAPEYGYTLKVDEKSDIYSFGVVLLELITGKMPLDPSFGESIDIVEWFRSKIRDNIGLEETLDPIVAGQCKNIQEEMLLALRIALLCTSKLPKDRPSTRDILTMLREAKPRRKSTSNSGHNKPNTEKPVFSTSPPTSLF